MLTRFKEASVARLEGRPTILGVAVVTALMLLVGLILGRYAFGSQSRVIGGGTALHDPEPLALRASYDASGDETGSTHLGASLELIQSASTTRSQIGGGGYARMTHATGTQSGSVMGLEGYAELTGEG